MAASTTCPSGLRMGRRSPSCMASTMPSLTRRSTNSLADGRRRREPASNSPAAAPRRTRSPTGAPMARRSRTTRATSATAGSGSWMPMVGTTTRSAAASPATRRRSPRATTGAQPGHRTAKKIASLRDLQALGITDRPVYVMNVDGSQQHRLTAAPALPGVPAWQPLGRVR